MCRVGNVPYWTYLTPQKLGGDSRTHSVFSLGSTRHGKISSDGQVAREENMPALTDLLTFLERGLKTTERDVELVLLLLQAFCLTQRGHY